MRHVEIYSATDIAHVPVGVQFILKAEFDRPADAIELNAASIQPGDGARQIAADAGRAEVADHQPHPNRAANAAEGHRFSHIPNGEGAADAARLHGPGDTSTGDWPADAADREFDLAR